MKKGILFILLLSMFGQSCSLLSKSSKSPLAYKEGDDLTYEITEEGEEYQILLNINGVEEYYVSYDWEMPLLGNSGTIAIKENALNTAKTLVFFDQDGYRPLENETAVWISRSVFKGLKANKKVGLSIDGKEEVLRMTGTETYSFGKEEDALYDIPVIIVNNADNSVELWIADDRTNPVIMQMTKADFRMDLVAYSLFY